MRIDLSSFDFVYLQLHISQHLTRGFSSLRMFYLFLLFFILQMVHYFFVLNLGSGVIYDRAFVFYNDRYNSPNITIVIFLYKGFYTGLIVNS